MAEEKKIEVLATTKAVEKENRAAMVPIGQRGIALQSLSDLMAFAATAVKGGAAPKGMTDGQAALAIQAGLERGLGLLGGLQSCVVINGVLSWRGQAAYALIQGSGLCKSGSLRVYTDGEGDEMRGVATAHRVGYAKPSETIFSVKDAKRAGLWGKEGPWRSYPERMLKWRALGFLARDVFPDVLGGFPVEEEALDYDDTLRPTPASVKPPALGKGSAKPDPILDVMEGKVVESEDAPAVTAPPTEAETVDAEPDEVEPPFASHEDADRELAEQDGLFSRESR